MSAPAAATAAALRVAGCWLGSVRFAVAADAVLQLLPCPSDLVAVPRRDGALIGAFTLRGVVVPVVDLRRWLPWPGQGATEPPAPAQLLVLRQGGHWLAVGIDRVDGLHRVSQQGVQPLQHGPAGDELFGSVVRLRRTVARPDETDSALGLLDVTALMNLNQVWARAAELDQPAAPGATESSTDTTAGRLGAPCALLDSEGELLAVPITHLRAVLPMPPLQPLWLHDTCRTGVARWRGRDVPVLRLLPSLGLGPAGAASAPLLAVLEHEGKCIGVPVQAVRDVRMLDPGAAQSTAAIGLAPGSAVAGLLPLPGGQRALLVDVAMLIRTDPMAALSSTRHRLDDAQASTLEAHVVVQAGAPWALPISALREVIELPEGWATGPDPATPWCHTWREHTLPLWDLRALKGHGATERQRDARVLILQSDASGSATEPVGLVVEALLHFLPARSAERHQLRRFDGRVQPFVVHREADAQRSFAILGPGDWPQAAAH